MTYSTQFRMGEYDRPLYGLFNFRPADFLSTSRYFGLELQESYFIAHLRDRSLKHQRHAVRPVYLASSSGVLLSTSKEDGLHSDPRGSAFLRGGFTHRSLDENGDLLITGSGGTWSGDTQTGYRGSFGSTVRWTDGEQLDLSGTLLGPGTQLLVPWRDDGTAQGGAGATCHTGIFYEVNGRLFDEEVVGIVALEQIFSPPGQMLHESVQRKRFVGAWNAFANVFEDGTVQYGQLGYGAGPFKYANFVDGERHVNCAVESIATEYREGPGGIRLGKRIEYHLANGETWECLVEPNGTMINLLESAQRQGSNAQVHKGQVRGHGENRKCRSWYAICEWFPDRLVNDPAAEESALPAGF